MSNDLYVRCFRCRQKRKIHNPYIYHFKKNKKNGAEGMCALRGSCLECGCKMSRLLPREYACRSVEYVLEQLTNKN